MKHQYEKKDRRQDTTDKVVNYIETHQRLPYQKEWDPSKCDGPMRPFNPAALAASLPAWRATQVEAIRNLRDS